MAQLTLELPDTLHHQLEGLARREGVQLTQYILYILTRQVGSLYAVQVISEEAVAQQEVDYLTLRQQWGKASPTQVEEVLAKREIVEPEPELKPEVIEKLRQRIKDN
jgi:hypothetical protein